MMAPASEQVFETVGVLEMILFKLPTRDLLLSQRVSKYWKDVIENSKKFQEALFMRAVEVPAGQSLLQIHGRSSICNTSFSHKYTADLDRWIFGG
jgi:hypothetical protein